ncbi:MAG: hypothetical protein QG650_727 [Patescibacteria group bacterium]|nr:hypothetical protein [Patescibacteria group bacterium]
MTHRAMTTITVDETVPLQQTHFRDMRELAVAVERWKFEQDIVKGALGAMRIPESELVNL